MSGASDAADIHLRDALAPVHPVVCADMTLFIKLSILPDWLHPAALRSAAGDCLALNANGHELRSAWLAWHWQPQLMHHQALDVSVECDTMTVEKWGMLHDILRAVARGRRPTRICLWFNFSLRRAHDSARHCSQHGLDMKVAIYLAASACLVLEVCTIPLFLTMNELVEVGMGQVVRVGLRQEEGAASSYVNMVHDELVHLVRCPCNRIVIHYGVYCMTRPPSVHCMRRHHGAVASYQSAQF